MTESGTGKSRGEGTVVYDIEIAKEVSEVEGGWRNPDGMGLGCAVVYDYRTNKYAFFGLYEVRRLVSFLREAGTVVSFNGRQFDNRVLLGNDGWDSPWKNIDLLEIAVAAKFGLPLDPRAPIKSQAESVLEIAKKRYGFRAVHDGSLKLDSIVKATLNDSGKLADGAQAPRWIKAGEWVPVLEYCLEDVRLTRRLYEHMVGVSKFCDGTEKVISIGENIFW